MVGGRKFGRKNAGVVVVVVAGWVAAAGVG